TEFVERCHNALCVLLVNCYILVYFFEPLVGKHSRRASLQNIRYAVGLGGTVAHPHCIEIHTAPFEFFGDYGIAATGTRKACRLGKRTDFYRASTRAVNLEDTVRK